eukprot:gene981-1331_t
MFERGGDRQGVLLLPAGPDDFLVQRAAACAKFGFLFGRNTAPPGVRHCRRITYQRVDGVAIRLDDRALRRLCHRTSHRTAIVDMQRSRDALHLAVRGAAEMLVRPPSGRTGMCAAPRAARRSA